MKILPVALCIMFVLGYISQGGAHFRYKWNWKRIEKQNFTNSFGYAVEHSDPSCATGNITAPNMLNISFQYRGYFNNRHVFMSVLSLMKEAVRRNGSEYMFSLLYANSSNGFVVHQINGVFSDDSCMWSAYVDDNSEPLSSRGLLSCRIMSGQTLTFHYEKTNNENGNPQIIS